MWEEARGFCFSLQEGSKAEETMSPSAPSPAAASSPLSTYPLHQALRFLSPSLSESYHHHHHHGTPALPLMTARVTGSDAGLHTPDMPSLPSLTVHQEGAGEGCTPGTWAPPFPAPPGAWLAQSSLGPATEECLHAKQNVTSSPSHCMASAHPAPFTPTPPSWKPLSRFDWVSEGK